MQSSGSGLTFTDQDVMACRIVIGLITKAKYELKAPEIVESARGLVWIEELLKNIKDNVLDFSTAKMVEPAPQPEQKRGKK
jgi:hypothetical protein